MLYTKMLLLLLLGWRRNRLLQLRLLQQLRPRWRLQRPLQGWRQHWL
jgi:hypothetical protein